MQKYGRIKRMKVKNEEVKGHKKAMICFETKFTSATAALRKIQWRAEIYKHGSQTEQENDGRQKQYRTRLKCYACDKEGHKISECYKKS